MTASRSTLIRRRSAIVRRGFTLVEAIAAITVLATLGSVTSLIMFDALDGYTSASTSAQLHTELSVAFDRIVREMRNVQLDDGVVGVAPDIDSVTPTSMAWDDESITLSGSTLQLVVDGASAQTLLEDVSAFTVSTFDVNGTALASSLPGASCDVIRRIRLEVTLTRRGVNETLRTLIYLRSAMTGAVGG